MTTQEIFDKYIGKAVEAEDPSNLDQCFDWAFKYCDEIGVDRAAIRHMFAYEIFTKPNDLTLKYFDYVPNTANGVPPLGAIIVFGTGVGPAGHVAVVQTADTNQITSTDQNWNGHKYVEYIKHPYDNVLGWLVLKSAIIAQPIAQLPVMNDQTKIPAALLATDQDLEIQQIRGLLSDERREKEQLKDAFSINNQQAEMIADLRAKLANIPVAPILPPNSPATLSSYPISQLFRELLSRLMG